MPALISGDSVVSALSIASAVGAWLWHKLRSDKRADIRTAARSAFEVVAMLNAGDALEPLMAAAKKRACEGLQMIGLNPADMRVQAWIDHEIEAAAAELRPKQLIEMRLHQLGRAVSDGETLLTVPPTVPIDRP